MPTHKSAEKRILTNAKANLRNRMIRASVKTAVKKVLAAANKEEATKCMREAVVVIDKACQKGVFHANNAARKKSRIALHVNKIK